MSSNEVKAALRGRHPGGIFAGMPGAWTCIEEWRGIDLLAFSAWSSAGGYARVGYEVKVSRADLRRELLAPSKRATNVAWCNEFYFAVPQGLLPDQELAWVEPEWEMGDFVGEPCSGFNGVPCRPWFPRKTHRVKVPIPNVGWWPEHEHVVCPTCNGKGATTASRVEREAPTCWVPRDVGLVVVNERGTRLVRRSPRRKEVAALGPRALGQFVRWVSVRPDPRHAPSHVQAGAEASASLTKGAEQSATTT